MNADRPFAIRRLAILGVGLIGGSAALALRKAGVVDEIVGYGRGQANLEQARTLDILDTIAADPAEAVTGADVVLLSVPVGATRDTLATIAPHLEVDAVITDGGSVKQAVMTAAQETLGTAFTRFVPGHPIAGTEHSGAAAAFDSLFQNRRTILTPTDQTDSDAITRIRTFWEYCGASVCRMTAAHHDQVLASTSHLPHVLAYTLVDTLARMDDSAEIFEYASGGFADFTRVASSSPTMWSDIATANDDALLLVLDNFMANLQSLRTAIVEDDRTTIHDTFERAKSARDAFVHKKS